MRSCYFFFIVTSSCSKKTSEMRPNVSRSYSAPGDESIACGVIKEAHFAKGN